MPRPRNLRKVRDGSLSRHPAKRFWLAADAADVNRPGRVVVGARDSLGGGDDLAGLDEREEGPVGVELPLDLLEELAALTVVGGRRLIETKRLECRVCSLRPARAKTDELTRKEDEVVVRVGVVGSPQPQAELLVARAIVGESGRDGAARQVDLDADGLQVGLDLLRERAEGEAVQGEVARKAEIDGWVRDARHRQL